MLIRRLLVLVALYIVCATVFMTLNARGNWDFVLWFRGTKLLAISLVATAVSVATLLFQTLTRNRILTPSLMGFDSLYMLLQTVLVYLFGGMVFAQLPTDVLFVLSFSIMIAAALGLFGTLLGGSVRGTGHDLHRLLLTGIIFGVLFRSFTSFLMRLIDPNDFVVAATASVAQFNRIDVKLLTISFVVLGLVLIWSWRSRHTLDVIGLGRDAAINLGVNYKRQLYLILIAIALLVSVSTALVGPIAFFGLFVCNLAYLFLPTYRHGILMPATSLIAACILLGGQTILEQVLNFATPLSVVIELLGGITFLVLVFQRSRR